MFCSVNSVLHCSLKIPSPAILKHNNNAKNPFGLGKRRHDNRCLVSSFTRSVPKMEAKAGTQPGFEFLKKKPYSPPSWASHLNPLPSQLFSLGHVIRPFLSRSSLSCDFHRSFVCCFVFYWLIGWWFVGFGRQFPTPIHKWNLPDLPANTEVWLKVC